MQNLLGKKKAKMNNSETKVKTEADSSSSDHPCPLALVTASNVRKDTQVFVLFAYCLLVFR